ncbi:uncharacterized protein LOC588217 [Strongylocentrotus purpuratus]|uniref:Uncharacterized protein n=1 Tax=Strongylocentrotus purpuratus TaxID=7668 RepID=A0A7M7RI03_STRPU|nr:uncharacterized protein LOC588217 [Strongylocentrotus purpuratus]|eukprot:XP_800495.1 PREDICTED: uncharacterized protein LOC588217 [Strongylocentrotus purpuratus]
MKTVLAIVCFFASLALLEAQSFGGSSGEQSSVGMMGGNGLGGGGQMNGNNYDNDNELETNELDNEFESNAGMPNLFGNGASNLSDRTSGGQKAGIVIGTIIIVALVAGGVFYFIKRR